jgi:Zn-dependent protease with chaperone function
LTYFSRCINRLHCSSTPNAEPSMPPIRPRSSRTVRQLARQLTGRALLGLGALVAFGLVALVLMAVGLRLVVDGQDGLWQPGLGLALVVGAGLFLRRLAGWLRAEVPAPEGVRLDRERAPSLYRLVDRLAARVGAPRVDGIRICADMNAAIHQRPARGAWGRLETTLLIGLPLVHSVSPRQLAAILAHEMGHLGRQRAGWGGWGAHVRAWWHRVCERIASDDCPSAWLLARLFGPWAERELLQALRLNHLEEYEADRVAARVVGAKLLGDTLVEVAMKADFIESDYWDKIMSQAEHLPRPSMRPFRDMGMGVAAGFHALPRTGLLHSLVTAESDSTLHPTLTDRLVALGVSPRVPPRAPRTAANFFLRPALSGLSRRFDGLWWRHTRPAWRRYYRQCQSGAED